MQCSFESRLPSPILLSQSNLMNEAEQYFRRLSHSQTRVRDFFLIRVNSSRHAQRVAAETAALRAGLGRDAEGAGDRGEKPAP